MFQRYLASMDDTLKELKPCLAKVNHTLERLDERLAPVVQHRPLGAERLDTQPSDILTPVFSLCKRRDPETVRPLTQPTVNEPPSGPPITTNTMSYTEEGTILKYFVKINKDVSFTRRGNSREPAGQPTPLGGTSCTDGLDTPPSDVSMPHEHSPARVDWGCWSLFPSHQRLLVGRRKGPHDTPPETNNPAEHL